jgi:hypothetical protein
MTFIPLHCPLGHRSSLQAAAGGTARPPTAKYDCRLCKGKHERVQRVLHQNDKHTVGLDTSLPETLSSTGERFPAKRRKIAKRKSAAGTKQHEAEIRDDLRAEWAPSRSLKISAVGDPGKNAANAAALLNPWPQHRRTGTNASG